MTVRIHPLLKLFLFLTLLFILPGCYRSSGEWKNEQINGDVRADFHARLEELITVIKFNQIKRVRAILSRELNSDDYTESLVDHLSNRFNDDNYSLFDEYHIISKFTDDDTVKATGYDINRYGLIYPQPAHEMYVAFYLPKKMKNAWLISIIYSKLDYGWRVTSLDAEHYTINGKTGPELFNIAKDDFNKGYLIDAVNTAAMAESCIKPAPGWQYPDQDNLHDFYGRIVALANDKFKFPLVLNEVPTKPKIFRVFNQANDEGSFPMVHYLSSIKLKEEAAIRRENAQIRKVIGKIMPGIDKNKKYVQYSAFNELPSAKREVDRVEMTDTLKQH